MKIPKICVYTKSSNMLPNNLKHILPQTQIFCAMSCQYLSVPISRLPLQAEACGPDLTQPHWKSPEGLVARAFRTNAEWYELVPKGVSAKGFEKQYSFTPKMLLTLTKLQTGVNLAVHLNCIVMLATLDGVVVLHSVSFLIKHLVLLQSIHVHGQQQKQHGPPLNASFVVSEMPYK